MELLINCQQKTLRRNKALSTHDICLEGTLLCGCWCTLGGSGLYHAGACACVEPTQTTRLFDWVDSPTTCVDIGCGKVGTACCWDACRHIQLCFVAYDTCQATRGYYRVVVCSVPPHAGYLCCFRLETAAAEGNQGVHTAAAAVHLGRQSSQRSQLHSDKNNTSCCSTEQECFWSPLLCS